MNGDYPVRFERATAIQTCATEVYLLVVIVLSAAFKNPVFVVKDVLSQREPIDFAGSQTDPSEL